MPSAQQRFLPTLPHALRVFCAASLALTVVGVITRFVCAHVLGLTQYPYGFYVTRADGLDLMTFYVRFQHVHSASFFSPEWGPAYAYPAAVAPVYWLLFRVRHAQIPFLLVGVGGTLYLAWRFALAMCKQGASRKDAFTFVAILTLCSYPLYFEFARGNVEIFMWFLTAGAIYAILHEKPWLGATLLGFAIAMKIYPFVLLGLFLSRRRYLPIVLSIAVAVLYSLFSLWMLCPSLAVAQAGVNAGVANFQLRYALPWRIYLSGVDHSLYGLIKRFFSDLSLSQYATVLHWYMIVAAVSGLLAYFLVIRKLPVINQVICLTIAFILLPPASYDYTLLHLYTPFCLWTLYLLRKPMTPSGTRGIEVATWCFVVLLSQVGELVLHGDRLGGQIKAVALLALFVVGLVYPLQSEFDTQVEAIRALPARDI